MVRLTVNEGPRYRIGDFEVNGAKRFSNEDIARFYPFTEKGKSVDRDGEGARRPRAAEGRSERLQPRRVGSGDGKVQEAYENEGYIYASIRPIVERRKVGKDSVPTVDLRWEIDERTPAIVNRVDIVGNDVTTETCIRDQLFILPGDVFNRERLIQSYRNIANLGFFEQDMPPPETNPANDQGDIDLVFHVKEKRTGNVNFGASVGQGTGVGGFIGFDQPNLFGECKRGSLQWQFGRYISDFSMSYTDPRIKQSNVSGTISLYKQRSRFIIRDIGVSNTERRTAAVRLAASELAPHPLLRQLRRRARELRRRRARLDDQLQRLLPIDARASRSTTTRDWARRSRWPACTRTSCCS